MYYIFDTLYDGDVCSVVVHVEEVMKVLYLQMLRPLISTRFNFCLCPSDEDQQDT